MKMIFSERRNIIKQINNLYHTQFFSLGGLKIILLITSCLSPLLFKFLIDDVLLNGKLIMLKWICLGYIGLYLLESLGVVTQRIVSNRLFNKLAFDLRLKLWRIYTRRPVSFYQENNVGDLKTRIDQDVDKFEIFFSQQIIDYLFNWVLVLITGIILIILNWKLALFGFVMVPVSFLMTNWLGNGVKRMTKKFRNTWGECEGWLFETIQGWKEVKALNIEKQATKTFTSYWHELSSTFFVRQLYWFGNRSFITVKDFFITKMNIYFIGGILIFAGEITIGSLLVFMKYFEQFFKGINDINNLDIQLNTDIPSIERVIELLPLPTSYEHRLIPKGEMINHLRLEEVNFAYSDSEEHALKGVNLEIYAKERVAIVGRSGCGKTTLVKLLLGLYEVTEGKVWVNDRELRELDPVWYHRKVGVVMQDSILYNMSIRDNLLLAKPSATQEDLDQACQLAYIDEFIQSLPDGYETIIGEKGIKLSGGQRQRLVIARLFLTDVEVVFFDEATSSLDSQSEQMVHKAIEGLAQEKTVVIIAHRLSSILLADKVIVMDEGEVVGLGEHEELLASNPIYRSLFEEQYNGLKAV